MMKPITVIFIFLFIRRYDIIADGTFSYDEVLEDSSEEVHIISTPPTSPKPLSLRTIDFSTPLWKTSISSSTTSSPVNDLSSVSIQDILLSGIDGTDKVNKKIANTLVEFSTNPKIYQDIELNTADYSFSKKLVQFSTSKGNLSFYNLKVLNTQYGYNTLFATEIGCDLQGNAKIQVSLPEALVLTANLTINDITENTKKEGTIFVTFREANLLRRSKFAAGHKNTESNISSKIIYRNSTVQLEVDNQYQALVYEGLSTFLNQIESSLAEYLQQQLNNEILKRNIVLANSCSKLTKKDNRQKKIGLPFFNNYMNSLYVIQNTKVETWKTVTLNAGPVVIEGLDNFTSAESIISYIHKTFEHYRRYDSMKVVIKTGNLKGKFEWYYNLEQNEENRPLIFAFFIDNIEIENQVRNVYHYNYGTFKTETTGVSVKMGKINVKPFQSKSDTENDYERKFINVVLSEYLRSAITQSLNDSITEEIKIKSVSLVNLFDN